MSCTKDGWLKLNRGYIIIASIVLLLIIVYFKEENICVIKRITGIPCPGCGMTRAYFSLLSFDFNSAFFYHPLFILPILLAVVITFRKHWYFAKLYKSTAFWVMMLSVIVLVWVARLVLLFPSIEPMQFDNNAVLPRVLRYIAELTAE